MLSSDLRLAERRTTQTWSPALVLLATCTALLGILSGCATAQDANPGDRPRSVQEFAKTLGDYREVDFSFNSSPSVALEKADVVAVGRLDGLTLLTFKPEISDGQPQPKALLAAVRVDEVVKGDIANFADGIMYVHIPMSAVNDLNQYLESPPIAQVAIVAKRAQPLVEAGRWVGEKDVSTSAIVSSFPDGLWFQGPDDSGMVGIEAEARQLPPAWNSPTTVDDYTKQLKQAR